MPVVVTLVEDYNPEWPLWFEQLKERLKAALGGTLHTIEHVGSTAVPGMWAKPIIDIVIVTEAGAFPAVKARLETIGYAHNGDQGIPAREVFKIPDEELKASLPAHHLYACEKSAQPLVEHLAYREFMRRHPEWRQKLNALKRSLCEQYDNDRQAYIDGKDAMVKEITRLALNSQL
jgi:GrpB-like predicted nucleotidyltransferase (UPF0157 family)